MLYLLFTALSQVCLIILCCTCFSQPYHRCVLLSYVVPAFHSPITGVSYYLMLYLLFTALSQVCLIILCCTCFSQPYHRCVLFPFVVPSYNTAITGVSYYLVLYLLFTALSQVCLITFCCTCFFAPQLLQLLPSSLVWDQVSFSFLLMCVLVWGPVSLEKG